MSIGNKVKDELMAWGGVGVVLVILSVILLKFKGVSGVTSALNTTIDLIVTAISEPANWIIIVIIGVIGFALLKLFQSKNK